MTELATQGNRVETSSLSDVSVNIDSLNHYYGSGPNRKQALFDISLQIHRGEIVIMTGPTGSGKTTLLTLIGGLRSVQEGVLEIGGKSLRGMKEGDLTALRRDIGYIFQMHNLLESLSAFENVKMAMDLHNISTKEARKRAEELLTELGLGHRIDYSPSHLSGGQRQRVAIARALINRPSVILADEPTAALDKTTGRTVVEVLRKRAKQEGCTIFLVTHDTRILDIADRIVRMVDGQLVSDDASDESDNQDTLKHARLFAGFSAEHRARFETALATEIFPDGSTILRQGEQCDSFFVVRRGSVDILANRGDNVRHLATLGQGNSFGEDFLLKQETSDFSFQAVGDVEVGRMSARRYRSILADFESESRSR